jgi:PAS domain S-box-containing protein
VPLVAMTACVLLGQSSTVLFAVHRGNGDMLAFVLLTLYLAAALFFAWGWRAELVVWMATVVPWVLAHPYLRFYLPTLELWTAIVIGSSVCLALAEGAARSFGTAFGRGRRAQAATDALAASRDAYRDLAENASDLIYTHDLDGRLTYVNEAFARFAGLPATELIGRRTMELILDHPATPDVPGLIARVAAGETLAPQLLPVGGGERGIRWIECAVTGIRGGDGRVIGLRGIARDVSERVRTVDALRASEERYRGMVESQHDLIARFDRGGRFTFVNDAYCKKYGRRREELVGHDLIMMVHEDDVTAVRESLRKLDAPPHRTWVDTRIVTPAGVRWIAWEGCGIKDERGRMVEIQCVGRDVTDRRATEEALRASLAELRRSEEKLRLLAQRRAVIREEERKRLGFDLHDDVCQELVGIGILVESVRRQIAPLAASAAAGLEHVAGYLNEVVEHLRLLAHDLRPLLLRDLGLEGSLRSLAEGMASARTRVVATFPAPVPRLEETVEIGVYRIAQEAVTNALRHAAARSVVVTLAAAADTLTLEVRDDGRGFEPDDRQRPNRLGLVGMEERALALGGHIEVCSQPGKGTTVRLECPLAARVPASAA